MLLGIRQQCPHGQSSARITSQALTLSPNERADVAAELLASLDEPSDNPKEVATAWAVEIERGVLSGESVGESWDDVRERLARQLSKK